MRLTYEVPQGFTDEIRWFRFFPLRSLIVMLCTAAPGLVGLRMLSFLNKSLTIIILWSFVVVVVTGSTMIRIPNTEWLSGGDQYIDQYLIKRLIRRKKRCLYIKGYDQLRYEEEERAKL